MTTHGQVEWPDRTGTDAEAAVRFIGVQKTYDGRRLVVRDLDLDIRRGEFLTLLGPSGSGKTTTLMMLAGFEPATRGEILLNGRPINRVPPNKRGIGMVFQNYALFPHMTVAENLAFPLQVRSTPRAEVARRVAHALDMVDLAGFDTRLPAQLSGGQQQRVAVARALIFEPKVVLMDEPLGALDKQLREQMQYEIKALHDRLGVTVVYVTHDQGEALTMSDRIAVFDQGRIQQLSTPAELYEQPASAFVARFIGENNRLSGTVLHCDGAGECTVRLAGGQEVCALAAHPLQAGQAVLLSVRPERVRLGPDPSDASLSHLRGVVADRIYHGDHIRIHLHIDGQGPFIMRLPNDGSAVPAQRGDAVTVSWRARDCRALDHGEGGGPSHG